MANSCAPGDEISGSIKEEELLDRVSMKFSIRTSAIIDARNTQD